MGLKTLIKSVVPRPVINFARDWEGQMRLNALPDEKFVPDHLQSETGLSLDALLNDRQAANDWAEDHGLIAGAIGDRNLMGGVNPGDRRAIYTIVHALKPAKVLEVGTHIAASSLYIAAALRRQQGRQAVLTTVDILDVNAPNAPWKEAGYQVSPAEYAARLDLDKHIVFVASPAIDFMADTPDLFDFIFLDGDHQPDSVYREVSAALDILNPGGVVLLHDYYPGARALWSDGNVISGPFRALDRIRKENPAIIARPLGELPWPTKQGSRVTSLAAVLKRD